MRNANRGQIVIECPNTIFHLYVESEEELSKVQVFMNNIRHVDTLGVNDIYNWCNRQKVEYRTSFNYDNRLTLNKMIKSYIFYFRHKIKYAYRTIET